MTLSRRIVAEFVGTAFLVAAVVGSGIMGERLAGGNLAIALLNDSGMKEEEAKKKAAEEAAKKKAADYLDNRIPKFLGYFERGLQAFPNLTFELLDVMWGISSVVLYYLNQKGTKTGEFMELDAHQKVSRVVANYN